MLLTAYCPLLTRSNRVGVQTDHRLLSRIRGSATQPDLNPELPEPSPASPLLSVPKVEIFQSSAALAQNQSSPTKPARLRNALRSHSSIRRPEAAARRPETCLPQTR